MEVIGKVPKTETGTKTTFMFDREIFKGEMDYRFETLVQRFREMAFVTRGVTIRLLDQRDGRKMTLLLRRRDHFLCALPQPQPRGAAPGDARRA